MDRRRVRDLAERVVYGGPTREALARRFMTAMYQSRHRRHWHVQARGEPHFTDQDYIFYRIYSGDYGDGIFAITRGLLSGEIVPRGGAVLDIGCGDGGFTKRFLAPRAGHIDAVDIEPTAIEWAKTNNAAPNIEYRLLDAVNEPFPRSNYDLVAFDGAIGHIAKPDSDKLLGKIAAAIGDTGIFVGSETLGRTEGHDHLQFFDTLEDLKAFLGEHFPVVRVTARTYDINDGTFTRVEAYWRCARTEAALDALDWS